MRSASAEDIPATVRVCFGFRYVTLTQTPHSTNTHLSEATFVPEFPTVP
jgi:hypothetical protein